MACIFTTKSSRICGDLLSSEDLTNRVCSGPLCLLPREAVDQAWDEDQDHNHHKHVALTSAVDATSFPIFASRWGSLVPRSMAASMAVFTHSVTHTPPSAR